MQACNSRQGPKGRQRHAGTGRQKCRQAETGRQAKANKYKLADTGSQAQAQWYSKRGTGKKALAGRHR